VGLTSSERNQLYHCHAFVQSIVALLELDRIGKNAQKAEGEQQKGDDPLTQAESIHAEIRKRMVKGDPPMRVLRERFGQLATSNQRLGKVSEAMDSLPHTFFPRGLVQWELSAVGELRANLTQKKLEGQVEQLVGRASTAIQYFDEEVARSYFGLISEYRASGILSSGATQSDPSPLQVVDLPSFPSKRTSFLVINSRLEQLWFEARVHWMQAIESPDEEDKRTPTFIVVDEAHHLMPDQVDSGDFAQLALREQFRSIAAEGRKFGLFLILVTQRSDKLDQKIISECENTAILRIKSKSSLPSILEPLGLNGLSDAFAQYAGMGIGRAVLFGKWSDGNVLPF